jgi:hypothetical protein
LRRDGRERGTNVVYGVDTRSVLPEEQGAAEEEAIGYFAVVPECSVSSVSNLHFSG